jgi:hypothetical protein
MRHRLIPAAVALGLLVVASTPVQATPLSPFIDLQESKLAVTTDGAGLRGLGSGARNLQVGIKGAVRFALLYWVGRDRPCTPVGGVCNFAQPFKDQQLVFSGTPITGTVIGTETQPAGSQGATLNIGYFADVTSLVAAAGVGQKTFFLADGNLSSNLWRLDGAALFVAYTDPDLNGTWRILVQDNMDFAWRRDPTPGDPRSVATVSLNHGAAPARRVGRLWLLVGDAAPRERDLLRVNGSLFTRNSLDASSGRSWDIDRHRVAIPAGAASTSVRPVSSKRRSDSFLWTMVALRVKVP